MAFPDSFGPGGGMPDMQSMLAQAMQMQEQMLAAQQELENTIVSGSASGGLVTARVTGTGDLVGLEISPAAVDPEDTEMLADLVVAAVRDAKHNADELAQAKLGPLAGGMPGFGADGGPGGALGGLFG